MGVDPSATLGQNLQGQGAIGKNLPRWHPSATLGQNLARTGGGTRDKLKDEKTRPSRRRKRSDAHRRSEERGQTTRNGGAGYDGGCIAWIQIIITRPKAQEIELTRVLYSVH